MIDKIVVVGASLAGVRAAEALRRHGFEGRLTVVGSETHFPPYDRPPMSKNVLTGVAPQPTRLRVQPELEAELLVGNTARRLELATRSIVLNSGQRIPYDGLVIATGAHPRLLPVMTDRGSSAYVLRTYDDCLRLRQELLRGPRVVVIGGGFLGCEIAASCRTLGLDVTVVEAGPTLMQRVIGAEMGAALEGLHRDHGTTIRTGVGVESIQSDSVALADGTTLAADVVVAAVGATPTTGWLRHSGLDTTDGVLLDETCAAIGAPDIVAAGDVARWPNRLFGRTMRVEHWTNAVEQADAAARALLAADPQRRTPFAPVPYFWTDQYDTKWQFVGIPTGRPHIIEGSPAERRFVAAYEENGIVRGALCVNMAGRLGHYRRMIATRASADHLEMRPPDRVGTKA